MGIIENLVILLLLFWIFTGFFLLPLGGGLLNFIIAGVIIWLIYRS